MADSNFRGPVNSMGSLEVDAATAAVLPLDGPSMSYQGYALPDIRSAPFAKDGFRPGQQLAYLAGQTMWACDAIPQARNTTQIATTQIGTAALTVAMQTVGLAGVASAANIAVGVPIIPVGTSVATVALIAIDFGFTTGTTASNSSTVVVVDNTVFHLGQWIIVGNVGNSAATRSLITQVQSVSSNGTGVFILPVAATGLASVPIGQANLFGGGLLPPATQFGPAAASANAHSFGGATVAGLAKVVNPRETLSRNISMAGVTAVTYSAVVSGWDVWGNPMTEVISLAAQTTGAGKKAFKYIGSITSGTTAAIAISFGLGDTFGFPWRCDEWDQTEICWAGSASVTSNGFTAASPTFGSSTSTSGDVRGTIQISTAVLTGVIATAVSAVASNGTSRLSIRQVPGVWNQIAGTPTNTIPMFGVAQSTATT